MYVPKYPIRTATGGCPAVPFCDIITQYRLSMPAPVLMQPRSTKRYMIREMRVKMQTKKVLLRIRSLRKFATRKGSMVTGVVIRAC